MKKLMILTTLTLFSFSSFAQIERPNDGSPNISAHGGDSVTGGSEDSDGPSVTGGSPSTPGKVINANVQGYSPSTPGTISRREFCCMKCAGNKTHLNKSIVSNSKPIRCQPNANSQWVLKSVPKGRCINGASSINYLKCHLTKP